MYQKEIIYLGLYKDGDRLGSAGFLKVEKRDKDGSLSLVVKNVPHSINGKYPVRYYSGSDWKETDGIMVREGGGMWERQEPESLEQVRLQIMLPGGYLVEGASKEAVRQERAAKEVAQGAGAYAGRASVSGSTVPRREDPATVEGTVQGAEQGAGAYTGRASVSGTAVVRREEAVAAHGVGQETAQGAGAYTGRASVSGTAVVRREEAVAGQGAAQGAVQEVGAYTGRASVSGTAAVRREEAVAVQIAGQGVAQGSAQEVGAYTGRASVSGMAVVRREEAVAAHGVGQETAQGAGACAGRASVSGTAAVGREEAVAGQGVAQGATQETAAQERPKKIERIVVQRQEAGENAAAQERTQKPLMADALVIEGLKEDKWEQILDTYDNIHPYGDERVYVKLAPKDFIIMSGKYQHLVNNSFLLHGFYNYRHVILGKEGEVYYLGVPGVFYEREKMVALMFGFEAFECGSRESKPGEFGYYLRKVEL